MGNKPVRIVGVTANRQTFENGVSKGKSSGFYNALNRRYDLIDVILTRDPRHIENLNKLKYFRPNMDKWKRAAKINTPEAFRHRSRKAEKMLQKHDGDFDLIFQIHTLQSPGLHLTQRPYVLTTDNTHAIQLRHWKSQQSEKQAREWMELEKEVYRNAAYLFPWGSHVRKSMIEDYGCDPDRVFAFGTGANFQLDNLNKNNYDGQIALFVGRDYERKGGETLIKAWPAVREALPKAQLWFVGPDAEGKPKLPGVEWYGKISDRARVKQIFESASLFVLPTRFEPWGHVFLEAMGVGLACIGTNQFGMPDMITPGENGALIPPEDADALATEMINILSQPKEAERMGRNAFERVTTYYNWDALIGRMAPYIEQAVAEARSRKPV